MRLRFEIVVILNFKLLFLPSIDMSALPSESYLALELEILSEASSQEPIVKEPKV